MEKRDGRNTGNRLIKAHRLFVMLTKTIIAQVLLSHEFLWHLKEMLQQPPQQQQEQKEKKNCCMQTDQEIIIIIINK